jgi:ribose transport system substrate-binding protein
MSNEQHNHGQLSRRLGRRDVLRLSALLGLGGAASLLAACQSAAPAPAPTTAPAAKPAAAATTAPAPAAPTAAPAAPTAAPAAAAKPTVAATTAPAVASTKKAYLGTSIRSLDNPFHVEWVKGAKKFAAEVGLSDRHDVMLSEGDSQKQISQVQAFLAKAGKDAVMAIDPNLPPDTAPLVKLCEDAGVYCMSFFVKDKDLHPKTPYWVAYGEFNGTPQGYAIAKELFKAMGGKGKIVSILGPRGHSASIQRRAGLEQAMKETSGIELVGEENADWDRTKGLNVMQNLLVAHPDVTGVWSANDQMALGAVEALRSAGKIGQIPIVGVDGADEAVQGIIKGEYTATVSQEGTREGYYGLAIPYKAYMGQLDPLKEPPEHREFEIQFQLLTKENAQQYYDSTVKIVPDYKIDDIWKWVKGPATQGG